MLPHDQFRNALKEPHANDIDEIPAGKRSAFTTSRWRRHRILLLAFIALIVFVLASVAVITMLMVRTEDPLVDTEGLHSTTGDVSPDGRHSPETLRRTTINDLSFDLLNEAATPYRATLEYLDVYGPARWTADLGSLRIQDLAVVTAFSRNHMQEFRQILCASLMNYTGYLQGDQKKLIVYIMDDSITISDLSKLSKECPIVRFRFFPFHLFPGHVRTIQTYSFKPLIIAMALLEYKAVYWADTSIFFQNNVAGLTIKEYFEYAMENSRTLLLPGTTGHGVYSATNPAMYKFFPTNQTALKATEMAEAGSALWIGTPSTKSTILYRYVECALVKDCIAPGGAKLSCNSKKLRTREYAGCHRYDQSALNIIANTYFNYAKEKFRYTDFVQWKPHRI